MYNAFFVYKNEKYPFDLNLFQRHSNFFSENAKNAIKDKIYYFDLISNFDNYSNLSENSIKTFISYCQNQEIKLTNSNVIPVNFLSQRYEVTDLIKKTQEHITQHQHEIIDECLSNLADNNNSTFEALISYHISDYFDDDRLLNIPISSMHRILINYRQRLSEEDEFPVIEFLFKYIEKNGSQSSFLLSLFQFGPKSCEFLNEKLSENFNLVEFEWIKPTIFRSFHFMNKKKIEKSEEIQREFLMQQKSNIDNIRSNCVSLFHEILNLELFKSLDSNDDDRSEKISSSLIKYGLLFGIRSIFNNSFTQTDKILNETVVENSIDLRPSKFDILGTLIKLDLFSKDQSILLDNKDYRDIISHVAIIKTKQSKKSIVDLFNLIENKFNLIEFVEKIFPFHFFNGTKFEMLNFWIHLTKTLFENDICFSLTIDDEKFEFNKSSKIDCNVILIMNEPNSLSLSQGSRIQFSDHADSISLNIKDDKLIYFMLLELAKGKLKTATLMSKEDIFNFYFSKAATKQNQKEKILSIKDLFENNNFSMISMIWNLIFTLSELEIVEISVLINPIESKLLLTVQKLFKIANNENIEEIFAWCKWAILFDDYINIITNCVFDLNNSYDNMSCEDIDSLHKDIEKGIIFLKNEPKMTNNLSNFNDEIDKCQTEFNLLNNVKAKKLKIKANMNELILSLNNQEIHDEQLEQIKNTLIEEFKNVQIFTEEKLENSQKITDQFMKHLTSNDQINKELISWPPIDTLNYFPNGNIAENMNVLNTLTFYSKINSLIEKIPKSDANIVTILTKLVEFPDMDNSNKIILTNLIQNSDKSNLNCDIKYTLQALTFIKLLCINYKYCAEPKYLSDMINNYESRNPCSQDEIQWIEQIMKENQPDFSIAIPKFDPNFLVYLLTNKTNDDKIIFGPLLLDINNSILSRFEGLSSLMLQKFNSFDDAAKSIGQVLYNSLINKKEIPPQNCEDLKNAFTNAVKDIGDIRERIASLFSVANILDNLKYSPLSFNDISFLTTEWEKLLIDESLLNKYPSFLFWINQNKNCTKQLRKAYHNFSPKDDEIPLWLLYLRIISSKQCIRFNFSANTNTSKIMNLEAKNIIIKYLDDPNKQANFDLFSYLTNKLPDKIFNKNVHLIYDFLMKLSKDNRDSISPEILEKKYQYIKESISEITSLVLMNKSQELIQSKLTDKNSIIYFLNDPSGYIQNKINQIYPDHKIEQLFNSNYHLIDLSKLNQNPTPSLSLQLTNKINKDILSTPFFYLSSTNKICCTINKLECQIGPIFPSLLSKEPITINISSFIDEKMKISIENIEPNRYSNIISTKSKVKNRKQIRINANPPKIEGANEEIINLKGNLKMQIKGIKEKIFPFDIKLILLPMKAIFRCIQYPISELKNNYFGLCCDNINSEEKIDFELNNYYIGDFFKIKADLQIFEENKAEKPIIQIDSNSKTLSVLMPHTDQPIRSKFDIIIKLCNNFEFKVHCDFVIRPLIFTFEMYDYIKKDFVSDVCQIVLLKPKLIQFLHFRILILYKFKQKAKLSYNLPNIITIESSCITKYNNSNRGSNINKFDCMNDFEVSSDFSFYLCITNESSKSFAYNDIYTITLHIGKSKKTIQLAFLDPYTNIFEPNNPMASIKNDMFLKCFPCCLFSYKDNKWIKINTSKEIQKNPEMPFAIATPFLCFTNIEDFVVIDYHKDNLDSISVSNKTGSNIKYVKVSTGKITVKVSPTSQIETETKVEKKFIVSTTKNTSYYPIIGFIEGNPDLWFPVFDEYPQLKHSELLLYSINEDNVEKAKRYIQEIKDSYESTGSSVKSTSSLILVDLLMNKNVILNIKLILLMFPKCIQNQFESIINEIQPFINLGRKLPNEVQVIISFNLIVTFIQVFKQRYQEIETQQFCLQMSLSNGFIQKQVDKLFSELMYFDEKRLVEFDNNIKRFFEDCRNSIEKVVIDSLPKKSNYVDCILVNENDHSKSFDLSGFTNKTFFDELFNSKSMAKITAETVLSLPAIENPPDNSLMSYIKFILSCTEGSILLPAFVLYNMMIGNDQNQSENYFVKLFSIYRNVTCGSLVNNSVLSCYINKFIKLFSICLNRLKLAGIKIDGNPFIYQLQNKYRYNDVLSIPEFDFQTDAQIKDTREIDKTD